MKWISIILLVAFLLILQPLKSEARSTVFISFSVGGAVIVGGAFIFWSLSYGSRVSHRDPESSPLPPQADSLRNLRETGSQTSSLNRFLQSRPEEPEASAFELPLVTYRW